MCGCGWDRLDQLGGNGGVTRMRQRKRRDETKASSTATRATTEAEQPGADSKGTTILCRLHASSACAVLVQRVDGAVLRCHSPPRALRSVSRHGGKCDRRTGGVGVGGSLQWPVTLTRALALAHVADFLALPPPSAPPLPLLVRRVPGRRVVQDEQRHPSQCEYADVDRLTCASRLRSEQLQDARQWARVVGRKLVWGGRRKWKLCGCV